MKPKLVYAFVLAAVGACVFATAALGAAPANDMFASAQTVTGAQGSVSGSNVRATKEAGEPNHAGNKGGASVWYTWTPPAQGTVTISTFGSDFDTLLGVYTGSSVGSLTTVASNDDAAPPAGWSSVTFGAVAGTTYRIAVDGYNDGGGPDAGNVTLYWNWNPVSPIPANDNFSNAQAISGFCGSTTGTNLAATKEPGEPNHAGNVGGASVWYVWQALISGPATITTEGSDFDTLLGVYTGSSVSSLTQVAANDDVNPPNDTTSSVKFNALAGTTYYIAVDGYFGPSHGLHEGHIVFNWCQVVPAPNCNQKVNVRWHYRSHGSAGTWSDIASPNCQTGAISMGPQAMEGRLTVSQGQTVDVGYDFSLPGNKSPFTVVVLNPQVVFTVHCAGGAFQPTWTVTMPDATYSVNDSNWHPSADQHSPLVWQGTAVVPQLCLRRTPALLDAGGTFTANILLF